MESDGVLAKIPVPICGVALGVMGLANICRILEDEAVLEKMKTTDDVDWVVSVLSGRA